MPDKPPWPELHRKVSDALDVAETGPERLCPHSEQPCSDCLVDQALRTAMPIVIAHVREQIASNIIALGVEADVTAGHLARQIREGTL